MTSTKQLHARAQSIIAQYDIDTVEVAFADTQGHLRGKRIPASFFIASTGEKGFAQADASFYWSWHCELPELPHYNPAADIVDMIVVPDLATLRPTPWRDGAALCMADSRAAARMVREMPATHRRLQVGRARDRAHDALLATFMAEPFPGVEGCICTTACARTASTSSPRPTTTRRSAMPHAPLGSPASRRTPRSGAAAPAVNAYKRIKAHLAPTRAAGPETRNVAVRRTAGSARATRWLGSMLSRRPRGRRRARAWTGSARAALSGPRPSSTPTPTSGTRSCLRAAGGCVEVEAMCVGARDVRRVLRRRLRGLARDDVSLNGSPPLRLGNQRDRD